MSYRIDTIPLEAVQTDETVRPPNPRFVKSLETSGLLNPIHVIEVAAGSFQLVDGSRRLAAARQLEWKTIPALIETPEEHGDPKDLRAIILNTQRKNLQQLHVARHAYRLVQQEGRKQAELAREIHVSKSTMSTMLKVLDSSDLVAALEQEGLEFGAAKALAPLAPEERAALLTELREVQQRTGRFPSVREVERRVQQRQGRRSVATPAEGSVPTLIEALRGRGVPIDVRVGPGKQTQVRVVLTVSEADEAWFADLIQDGGE